MVFVGWKDIVAICTLLLCCKLVVSLDPGHGIPEIDRAIEIVENGVKYTYYSLRLWCIRSVSVFPDPSTLSP